ncbi:MAG: WD40/YVTN/BNR-like repeat-containing protein [Gaiellaceae bacterium]
MAKTKTRRRAPVRPVQHPKPRPKQKPRYGWLAWGAILALSAVGAFLLARSQAGGGSDPVEPPAAGLPNTPDYHSLLVDPADSGRIFLGTHAGLYESTDGGRSWEFAKLEGQDAMNLARASGETVWTAGHNVLARSTDGGETWEDVRPDGLPSLDIHGFAVDPRDPETLWAAVAGEGLYRSRDGGLSFELVSQEVGGGVMALGVLPDGRILAGDMGQGLLTSDNGGKRWQQTLAAGLMGLAINPDDPKRILASGPGILLSTDGGESWDEVQSIQPGAGPVAWAPSDAQVAYVVGFDRKLYRTSDGGASWQAIG